MGFLKHRYLRVISLMLSLAVLVVTAAYAKTVEHVVKACFATAGAGCLVCAQAAVIAYGAEAAFGLGYCD